MNFKKVSVLTLSAVLGLSLTSCKKGDHWELYTNSNYGDSSVEVSTNGQHKSFVESSYQDRTEILSKLEEYAIKNYTTGISIYDDSGLVMVSDTIELGVNKDENGKYDYVTGYGFGYYSDGKITKELSGEQNGKWKKYFHTYEPDDFKMLNYMNDKGSVVGTYNPLVASGYFGNRLNKDKNGYEWFPSLASEKNLVGGAVRPVPVKDQDGGSVTDPKLDGLYSTYRIYLRSDLEYKINTTNPKTSGFNNRKIALDDYLTPYLELFDASNGLARGGENLTGASAIKGMAEYSEYTSEKRTREEKKQKMQELGGVKVGTDSTNGDYVEITFATPCTPFYAMYYSTSSLYTPIPYEFLDAIGGIKIWGSSNADNTLSPVDTTLSTGPFVVESYTTGKEMVFKNADINHAVRGGENVYNPNNMPGIHVNFLTAATTDPLAGWKEYKAGKLTVCGVPKDKVKEEKNQSYTHKTEGSSTFKLNVNTTTKEEWEELFGINGVVTQTLESNYYQVKPIMSNDDFIKGISFAIDRNQYAEERGKTPTVEYFSDNYLSNPETGESYNNTKAHKDVMDSYYGSREAWEVNVKEGDKNQAGYNFDVATQLFKKAADDLKAAGTYKEGDTITLDVWWQSEASTKTDGEPLTAYIVKAWDAAETGITLKFNNLSTPVWSDVYYKKMLVGQFDFAIGGISGNSLNPINFMEVLKSDNSSGFCLNYGPNTNGSADIDYKGEKYTFDALYQAADTGAVVDSNGRLAKAVDAKFVSNVVDEEGNRVVKINVGMANFDALKAELAGVTIAWYEDPSKEDFYSETQLTADNYKLENGVLTVNVPAEVAEQYKGSISFDLTFKVTENGQVKTKVISLKTYFWQNV